MLSIVSLKCVRTSKGPFWIRSSIDTTVMSLGWPVTGSSTISKYTPKKPRPHPKRARPAPRGPIEPWPLAGRALSLCEVLNEPCCNMSSLFEPLVLPSLSLSMSRLLVRPACSLAPLRLCSSSSLPSELSSPSCSIPATSRSKVNRS